MSKFSKRIITAATDLVIELPTDVTPVAPVKPTVTNETIGKIVNANINPDQQRQIDLATEQFKQSVQRVDNQILNMYIQAVQNGDYAEAERILENPQESQQS